jgi:glycosyltransferase 2 family protein
MSLPTGRGAVRVGWLLLVLVAAAVAVRTHLDGVRTALSGLSPGWLVLAGVAVLTGVLASGLLWRSLLAATGSPLPPAAAARVFFVGQLAKYVPGSVWPLVSQVGYGRDYGVPATATAAALVLFHWVQLVTAALTAAVLLPAAGLAPGWWALAAVPLALLLHPGPQARAVAVGLRLLRRPALGAGPDAVTALRAAGWGAVMWICWGAHLWLLLTGLGTDPDLAGAAGAFAAAWAVGFVVLLAPAGAGVREAVLIALLLPVADAPVAVTAALLSRLLFTLADSFWAGAGLLAGATHRPGASTVQSPSEPVRR